MIVNYWRWLMRYQTKLNDMGLFLLMLGVAAFIAVLFLMAHRIYFLSGSDVTAGKVVQVEAENDRCGSRRSRHDCTNFFVAIHYSAQYDIFVMRHEAGATKNHNQPTSKANYRVGQLVKVRYLASDPQEAYLDEWFDIFALPMAVLLFGVLLIIKSSSEQIEND